MKQYSLLVDQLINSAYTRYNTLYPVISNLYGNSDADTIDIYININSILKPLYKSNYNASSNTAISSCIINLIAHYRRFFRTRYAVKSRFFLIYSVGATLNKKIHHAYKHCRENTNMQSDNAISTNLLLVQTICDYIPDTCFHICDCEPSVFMYHIINIENSKHPSLVITKDLYDYQLVNDKVSILRPKKYKSDDLSYIVTKDTCINQLMRERSCDCNVDGLDHGLYSLILSMTRLPERGLKSNINIPTAIDIIKNGVKNNIIINGHNNDIEYTLNGLYTIDPLIGKYFSDISIRYRVIDVEMQHIAFEQSVSKLIYQGIKNLYSPKELHEIANKYYSTNPLHLEDL